jgi:ankyrin repeat protein
MDRIFQSRLVTPGEYSALSEQFDTEQNQALLDQYIYLSNSRLSDRQFPDDIYNTLVRIVLLNYLPLLEYKNPSIIDINNTNIVKNEELDDDNIVKKGKTGDTLLHLIFDQILNTIDYYPMVKYLLSKGASIFVSNKNGITPLSMLEQVAEIDPRYQEIITQHRYYYEPEELPSDILNLIIETISVQDLLVLCSTSYPIYRKYCQDGNGFTWLTLYHRDISTLLPDASKLETRTIKDCYFKVLRIAKKIDYGRLKFEKYRVRVWINKLVEYRVDRYLEDYFEILPIYYRDNHQYFVLMYDLILNSMNETFVQLVSLFDISYFNIYKEQFLELAAGTNNAFLADYLIEQGANDYRRAFLYATEKSATTMMTFFLDLYRTEVENDSREIRHLLKSAIYKINSLDALLVLIDNGLEYNNIALSRGIDIMNPEIVRWTLEHGASTNYIYNKLIDIVTHNGESDDENEIIFTEDQIISVLQYLLPKLTEPGEYLTSSIFYYLKDYPNMRLKVSEYMISYLSEYSLLDINILVKMLVKLLSEYESYSINDPMIVLLLKYIPISPQELDKAVNNAKLKNKAATMKFYKQLYGK